MFKDVVTSLKSSVIERVSSPLAGSFILSWTIWNWKLLATMLLGDEETSSRIQIVLTKYYDTDHLIKYPLISTIIFILFYPVLSLSAFAIWEWIVPTKRRLKAYFEGKTPLTPDEARAHRTSLLEEKNEITKLWATKENEVRELKNGLQEKENLITSLSVENYNNEENRKENEKNKSEAITLKTDLQARDISIEQLQSEIDSVRILYKTMEKQLITLNDELQAKNNAIGLLEQKQTSYMARNNEVMELTSQLNKTFSKIAQLEEQIHSMEYESANVTNHIDNIEKDFLSSLINLNGSNLDAYTIASNLEMKTEAVKFLIDRLQKKGLLSSNNNYALVSLTPKGRDLSKELSLF